MTAGFWKDNGRIVKRRGFSLIVVLILSLVGFSIMGAALQFAVGSAGSSRSSSATTVKYNFMQDAVEEGKSRLKESMDNTDPPPRYFDKPETPADASITSADQLLLAKPLGETDARALSAADLGRMGVLGKSGSVTVYIYDMQYDPKKVDAASFTASDLLALPPSVKLTGASDTVNTNMTTDDTYYDREANAGGSGANNAGAYLVRAALTVIAPDGSARRWALDTAVLQSNSKTD